MDILNALGNIGFDWRVALANFVNFLIVFWLLKKFVWAPLRTKVEEREGEIAKGLEDAVKAETALMMAKETEKEILNTAKQDAHEIVKSARSQAEETVSLAARDALVKSDEILATAKKNANELEAKSLERVKEQSVDLVMRATRAMLQEEVGKKGGDKLVKEMTSKL